MNIKHLDDIRFSELSNTHTKFYTNQAVSEEFNYKIVTNEYNILGK